MAPSTDHNIWAQMGYTPPRGSCNHKVSLLSTACPCLRFMIHPLKAATSFECDGCGHHASFHNMENKSEQEVIKRWQEEQRSQALLSNGSERPSKRRRPAITEGAERRTNGRIVHEEQAYEVD